MSPTKRLKRHSEPKRSGGEESKILRRCAPQDNSLTELVAGSNKVVLEEIVGSCRGDFGDGSWGLKEELVELANEVWLPVLQGNRRYREPAVFQELVRKRPLPNWC